ncbi:FYVE zinc finger [Dictyocaulus viviparus]|uniref:FYVE zinc finger n=1 Tax=Dictyocaulus viviparus TaxID=29172 RepID=A0A0D8YAN3_DICVI|nr:FYVE zinc finger [Dictyocaulus viviparus]
MSTFDSLDLLREEHRQLQEKYAQLQEQNIILQTRIEPDANPDDCFAGQLLSTVRSLFEHHKFSDIVIRLGKHELKCHKFLLTTRSKHWSDLETKDFIEISGVNLKAFNIVYRWMYTDSLPSNATQFETSLVQEVCQIAFQFNFGALQSRCIQLLKSRVDVENCISLFEFADMENIGELRDYCSTVVAVHWKDIKPEKFSHLSALSLLRLLKKNSLHVLHSIIHLNREDVLLVYLTENAGNISDIVNSVNEQGLSALELSLSLGHVNIASLLLRNNANCNALDDSGDTILMRMIEKGRFVIVICDAIACDFLATAGADLNFVQEKTGSTILHRVASSKSNQTALVEWICKWLMKINVNAVDVQGRTALLLSVTCGNISLAKALLNCEADLIRADNAGNTPLFVALCNNELELAENIAKYGGQPTVNHIIGGNSLLHLFVEKDDVQTVRFLLKHHVSINTENAEGETPLQIAVKRNNTSIVNLLLDCKASIQIGHPSKDLLLHEVISKGPEMLKIFAVKCKGINWSSGGLLSHALKIKALDCAKIVVSMGGQIEETDSLGNSLLIQRILLSDDDGASFLLELGASHSVRDSEGRSCLELAARNGLINTLKIICGLGVNINERSRSSSGYTVLMSTLSEGHYDCAALLVSLGCDLESITDNGLFEQSMLHHFIDVANEEASVFLIQSGCNGDAVRVSLNSNKAVEEFPLHRAVQAHMNRVVAALVTNNANLAAQDWQGRTACHIAVCERNHEALSELLKASNVEFLSVRDKFGHTPLSQALFLKEYTLATEMVNRQPHITLQSNGNGKDQITWNLKEFKVLIVLCIYVGENLLHISVKLNDLEGVLFLLSTSSDITRATDSSGHTALHYAADVDNELILRNLLLVGCEVNTVALNGSTALHIAARGNRPHHMEILLENGANADQVDDRHENALLNAVRYGSWDCVRILLNMSNIDGLALNNHGQSSLHLCAMLSNDKVQAGKSPVDICELLIKREASVSTEKAFCAYIDQRDVDGNTALMMAYMAGNGDVCRCLLRYGATMGARNADGRTIFTYETPTKLLLFRLLDSLEREPRWSDGDICDCGVRFSITLRKHHCRHCGRLVCAKCSEITMPIAKFGEEKRVRVCSLCVEVLTKGVR